MDDRTMINSQLAISVPTILNREYADEIGSRTKGANLQKGYILKGSDEYTVDKKMETVSGEADLYICTTRNHKKVVAKIYKRENPLKQGVVDTLKSIRSPYVARVYDVFLWNERTVVILQYYENGSLSGKRFTLEELKKYIIPNINNGLKAIHDKNLVHKDLKPANIMLCDDRKSVAIIDFGISSLLDEGNTVLLTQTGMTPIYSAPELMNGLALVESDYYSFGITLYELYCGKTPYQNMSETEILHFTSIQRIPLPRNMPAELQKLIAALTYIDITNRSDKSNPNRRWVYPEVLAWLRGDDLPSPGGFDPIEMPPFVFQSKTYRQIPELIEAMGLNWEAGKRTLYHGILVNHIRETNLELCQLCQSAIQQASQGRGLDDIVFFKFLYEASPQLKAIYWKGRRFESLSSFGREMLEALWKGNDSQYNLYDSILSQKVISTYITVRAPEEEILLKEAEGTEALWAIYRSQRKDMRYVYYLLAYLLSNQFVFRIEEEEIRTVDELAELLRKRLQESVNALISLTHKMISHEGELDTQLEAWLVRLGRKADIDRWKQILRSGGENR